MEKKRIKKATKKFLRAVNGNIDFVSFEKYIQKLGYRVIFFNTAAGDRELMRYGLSEKASVSKAFTYYGTAKIIFIDDNTSPEDKLYLLLHEIGHIVLGHLNYGRLSTLNGTLCDVEVDHFAHNVLEFQKIKLHQVIATIVVGILMAVFCFCLAIIMVRTPALQRQEVYITSTGTKYHRGSCMHIQGVESAAIKISDAEKIFEPCAVCNP